MFNIIESLLLLCFRFCFRLVGYKGGLSWCKHENLKVTNIKIERQSHTPMFSKDVITMIVLRSNATCNDCGCEFETWCNGEKIDKDGCDNDDNNIKQYDKWRLPPYFM